MTVPCQTGLQNEKQQWVYWDCPMVDPHVLLAFLWDSVKLEIDRRSFTPTGVKQRSVDSLGLRAMMDSMPESLYGCLEMSGCRSERVVRSCMQSSCHAHFPAKVCKTVRWLLWCMRSSLYVGFQSLRPILARLTWSLNKAFNEVCNETGVVFQVTEIAADWKFMRDFFCLTTHWNAGAAGRFCHFLQKQTC